MNLNAQWKTIINFPNYLISNNGSVFSLKTNKILKPKIESNGYQRIGLMDGKQILISVHRLVYQHFGKDWNENLTVDHINHIRTDNTISNLRIATLQQQQFNIGVQKNNKLGVKGVRKSGKSFRASMTYNGKFIHIGNYKTLEEASEAYKTKARELHGEFFRE